MTEPTSDRAALLDRAEQAHKAGRFALVRSLLAELSGHSLSAAEQQRATTLRDRLRPDPLVALLIVACLILFVSVVSVHWH